GAVPDGERAACAPEEHRIGDSAASAGEIGDQVHAVVFAVSRQLRAGDGGGGAQEVQARYLPTVKAARRDVAWPRDDERHPHAAFEVGALEAAQRSVRTGA